MCSSRESLLEFGYPGRETLGIVGMYARYFNQVRDNAGHARKCGSARS